jgi:hypothetical protein
LSQILAAHDLDGRTLAWDESLESKVRTLTAPEITDALRSAIDPSQISIVRAGDFKKAATTPPPASK